MTNLPSTEDMKAWETLIAERLEADAKARGERETSREALKCLKMIFALDHDPAHRAVLYGLIGLGEDIVEELGGSGPGMVVSIHHILSEFDRVGIEEAKVTIDAMHAVWYASLAEWPQFAIWYCKIARTAMIDHDVDLGETLARPVVSAPKNETVAQA